MTARKRSRMRLAGAVAGGLFAGIGITAMLLAGERKTGKPSELVDLERAGLARLGLPKPSSRGLPSAAEQATVQAAHLALSAAAGAVYAAATDEDAPVIASGIVFGLGFYAAMHWVIGPALGLKSPEWRTGRSAIAQHAANHVAFGLLTAWGAELAGGRTAVASR